MESPRPSNVVLALSRSTLGLAREPSRRAYFYLPPLQDPYREPYRASVAPLARGSQPRRRVGGAEMGAKPLPRPLPPLRRKAVPAASKVVEGFRSQCEMRPARGSVVEWREEVGAGERFRPSPPPPTPSAGVDSPERGGTTGNPVGSR